MVPRFVLYCGPLKMASSKAAAQRRPEAYFTMYVEGL